MEQLVKEYSAYLFVIVRKTLGDLGTREDVEECVNDVFFEYSRKWEKSGWDPKDQKGYLALLAKRRAIDQYRRLARQAGRVVDGLEAEQYVDHSERQDPEKHVLRKEERQQLVQELDNLGETDREILLRRYYLEQSVNEIAGVMKMKENTVSVRIRRALKRLAMVLVVILLLFILLRSEAAAKVMKKIFAFLPGTGVVESEENVYMLEKTVRTENDEFLMEITNARLTGNELVVYLVMTPQDVVSKEEQMEEKYPIRLVWGDEVLKATNSSGALSEVYHYELIFKVPEVVEKEPIKAEIHYGDAISCEFVLVGTERLAALEEVGAAQCHNDIWVMASAEQTEEGLRVDLYALNQSDERLMSLGQDRGGLFAYGQESTSTTNSYPIISEPKEEEYQEYYLRIGEKEYQEYEYLPRFGGYPSLLFRNVVISEGDEAVLVIPYLKTQTTESRKIKLPVPGMGESLPVDQTVELDGGVLQITQVTRNAEYWEDTLVIELVVTGEEKRELMDLDLALDHGFFDVRNYAIVYSRKRTEAGDITAIYWRVNEEEANSGKIHIELKDPVCRLTDPYELKLELGE